MKLVGFRYNGRLVFLLLTIWVAHFFYFLDFGLYEDDYAFVGPALDWSLRDLLDHTAAVFASWPQGRPLVFFLPQALSFIGSQLGGLHAIYLIAYVMIAINALLFYNMLRTRGTEAMAFIGALVFCLFPADTTHSFLTHALGLQASIMFLLVAGHLYLSGKRILSYFMILGALLTYESPFMVFLGVPLLKSKTRWDGSFRRELARHLAVMVGIFAVVAVIRVAMGEERVTEIGTSVDSLVGISSTVVRSLVIGPAAGIALLLYGPIRVLLHLNLQLLVGFLACLGFFIWVLRRLDMGRPGDQQEYRVAFRSRIFRCSGTVRTFSIYSELAKLFLAALAMLCLAYALSFTHFPPTARYGRGTSVHLAAAFGGALAVACVFSFVLSVAKAYRIKQYALVAAAVYLSLLVTYRLSIQLDFIQAWRNQQFFWSSVIETSPDMRGDTVIFVQDHDLPKTRYIRSNSWADPIILSQLFEFPVQWQAHPRLFVVQGDWTERVVREANELKWEVPTATWWSHWEVLPSSNVILLEMQDGKLVRRFGSIDVGGVVFELKPLPPGSTLNWRVKPLYTYLIGQAGLHPPAQPIEESRSGTASPR